MSRLRSALATMLILSWTAAHADEPVQGPTPAGIQAKFAAGLLAAVAKTEPAANIVVSPATLAAALNTLALGVSDTDRAAITGPLGLALQAGGANKPGTDSLMTMAVRLVFDKNLPLLPSASPLLDKNGIDHGLADLDGPSGVAELNGWVADKTKGAIPTIIDAPPGGGFVSLGALHFKARWQTSFPRPSPPAQFLRPNGTSVQVPMMRLAPGDRLFRADQRFAAVELTYTDSFYRMVIVASRDHAGLAPADLAGLGPWFAGEDFRLRRGELSMPRFALKDGHDLINALGDVGLPPERLKLMTYPGFTPERIHLDRILQKTAIEVDEDGTVAAAATAAIAERSIEADFVSVAADARFAFALRDIRTGVILAAGLVGDPQAGGR